jgi:hypothetical protein
MQEVIGSDISTPFFLAAQRACSVKIGLRNKTHLIHKQPSSSAKSVTLTN